MIKRIVLPVLLVTAWISLSEFLRNEFLLKSYWEEHYHQMGWVFPDTPVNGAVWGVWSLCLALFIFFLSKKFSLWETTFLSWLAAFLMMWIVAGNLQVLPAGILPYAVPLSVVETLVAAFIFYKMRSDQNESEKGKSTGQG